MPIVSAEQYIKLVMVGIYWSGKRNPRAGEAGGQDYIYASGLSAWCLSVLCGTRGCVGGWRWMTMLLVRREGQRAGLGWAAAGQAQAKAKRLRGQPSQGKRSERSAGQRGRHQVWNPKQPGGVCVCGECLKCVCGSWRTADILAVRCCVCCCCCRRSASCGVLPAGPAWAAEFASCQAQAQAQKKKTKCGDCLTERCSGWGAGGVPFKRCFSWLSYSFLLLRKTG